MCLLSCFVAGETEEDRFSQLREETIDALRQAGLTTTVKQSANGKSYYVSVFASEERLIAAALQCDYQLQLDAESALAAGLDKQLKLAINTVSKEDDCKMLSIDAWHNLFVSR